MASVHEILRQIGAQVFERGWLSSNCVLFPGGADGAAIVDTGYATHGEQTVALVDAALKGASLARVVNTHLHSDHCGGNAALQRRWPCRIYVPDASRPAVMSWDMVALSFRETGQRCERFLATDGLTAGSTVELGEMQWQVLPAPGHDPDALMFFQPENKVLISGDALWKDRLAIVFPELKDEPGYAPCREVLLAIERLNPKLVIPGHGPPFTNVTDALAASRSRLQAFEASDAVHKSYSAKALIMFHMLEWRRLPIKKVQQWLDETPIFRAISSGNSQELARGHMHFLERTVAHLTEVGLLEIDGEYLLIAGEE